MRSQLLTLLGLPCMLLPVSPLLPLRFSLSWNVAILIMVGLEVGFFGFLLIGTLCFLDLCDFFSHQVKEVFHHFFFKQVFYPFLIFFFWYSYYQILLCFMLPCIFLNPSSFFLSLFSFSCSSWVFFSTLSSSSVIQSSASVSYTHLTLPTIRA